jgi:hypothetical protein
MGGRQGAKQKRAVNVRERQAAGLYTITQAARLNSLSLEAYPSDVLARAFSPLPSGHRPGIEVLVAGGDAGLADNHAGKRDKNRAKP